MKAFVIYLPDREHSVNHAISMISQLRSYGFDANLFEGTDGLASEKIFKKEERKLYPYSIKSKNLSKDEIQNFLKENLPEYFWDDYKIDIRQKFRWSEKDASKINTPGVKGCFHSHYRLWKLCNDINEPIAIFEDDVKFFRGYTEVEFDDVLVLSLGKSSFYNEPYKTYLEDPSGPSLAAKWPNFSMPGASGYIIKPHAAKHLIKFYRNYYLPADNAINKGLANIQIHTYIMGRNTLKDEGNISMTKFKWEDK